MKPYDKEKDIPEPLDPQLEDFFKKLVDYQVKEKENGKLSHMDIDRFIYQGVKRNDPCPCGKVNADGKPVKFKKCCMGGE